MQRPLLLALLFIHLASVFPEVFVALNVQLDQVAYFDRVDFSGATVADLQRDRRLIATEAQQDRLDGEADDPDGEADLMHGLPQDVFVLVLVDVFALVVGLDGQLHLLHGPLLGVQLLQVLSEPRRRVTMETTAVWFQTAELYIPPPVTHSLVPFLKRLQ